MAPCRKRASQQPIDRRPLPSPYQRTTACSFIGLRDGSFIFFIIASAIITTALPFRLQPTFRIADSRRDWLTP